MRAEMWLGYLFETGSYGCPRDYPRSYLWYRRAAIGEHQKEVERLINKIEKKKPKEYFCGGIACDLARNIVSLKGMLNAQDVSSAESMLEQWKPGQCEQELVGTGRSTEIK
jgi:TPR repeat protein